MSVPEVKLEGEALDKFLQQLTSMARGPGNMHYAFVAGTLAGLSLSGKGIKAEDIGAAVEAASKITTIHAAMQPLLTAEITDILREALVPERASVAPKRKSPPGAGVS